MKRWLCYAVAVLLGGLGLFVIPSCVRDARRLARLNDEAVQLSAEIARIEEERVRRRGRPDEILEQATVRYVYAGRHYESRHSLPGPSRRHQVGQRLPIVLLPDEPARSYAVHELTGNWLLALFLPALLFFAAGMFTLGGRLLGSTSPARPAQRKRRR